MDLGQWFETGAVEPLPPLRFPFDEAHLTQHAQVLRDRRIGDPERLDAFADRPGLMGQKAQKRPAIGVGYGMENVGMRLYLGACVIYI